MNPRRRCSRLPRRPRRRGSPRPRRWRPSPCRHRRRSRRKHRQTRMGRRHPRLRSAPRCRSRCCSPRWWNLIRGAAGCAAPRSRRGPPGARPIVTGARRFGLRVQGARCASEETRQRATSCELEEQPRQHATSLAWDARAVPPSAEAAPDDEIWHKMTQDRISASYPRWPSVVGADARRRDRRTVHGGVTGLAVLKERRCILRRRLRRRSRLRRQRRQRRGLAASTPGRRRTEGRLASASKKAPASERDPVISPPPKDELSGGSGCGLRKQASPASSARAQNTAKSVRLVVVTGAHFSTLRASLGEQDERPLARGPKAP